VFFSPPATEGVCDRCGGVLVHRTDDEPETVRRRLEVYEEQTAPLVSFYEDHPAGVVRIAADRTVDDVYDDFARAVRGAP
jgi:adenylate kinase